MYFLNKAGFETEHGAFKYVEDAVGRVEFVDELVALFEEASVDDVL